MRAVFSRTVWSNYRPAGRMWTATTFSVAGGSIQKKSSNLKLVENRVRLYLCHGIACAGQYVFAQEQDLVQIHYLHNFLSVYHFILFIF